MKIVRSPLTLVLNAILVVIDFRIIIWLREETLRVEVTNYFRAYDARYRENAFVGMDSDDLFIALGDPVDMEMQDDEQHRGALWWPSWDADAGRNKLIRRIEKDKSAWLCMFARGDYNVYVWLVEDTNGVSKVVYDIACP